jgi:hypothetical protein
MIARAALRAFAVLAVGGQPRRHLRREALWPLAREIALKSDDATR